MSPRLDQATIKRVLRYTPRTGQFFWRRRSDVDEGWNTRYANKEAGSSWGRKDRKTRYRLIKIFGRTYTAHQLAWLYMTGKWPIPKIDHRDLDGENNRWLNLRLATNGQNGANRGRNSNNTTGLKGVYRTPSRKFRATICVDRIVYHIGVFPTGKMAHKAYQRKAGELLGDFARAS